MKLSSKKMGKQMDWGDAEIHPDRTKVLLKISSHKFKCETDGGLKCWKIFSFR